MGYLYTIGTSSRFRGDLIHVLTGRQIRRSGTGDFAYCAFFDELV